MVLLALGPLNSLEQFWVWEALKRADLVFIAKREQMTSTGYSVTTALLRVIADQNAV